MRFKLALLLAATVVPAAVAADLSVLCAGAVESALRKLARHYEREFGRDVDVVFGTGPELTKRLAGGDRADVLIAPARVMEHAAKAGAIVVDSQVAVARVGVGVAVRRGTAPPNVATAAALKDALLRAGSVVYNKASTGQYLETLFERMGILERIEPKTTRYVSAAEVLEHVLRGSRGSEIGFGPITAIKDFEPRGVTLVGPLPADVQSYTTYIAAVMSAARAPDAGRDFIRYLTSAAARRTFAATGVESSR
ncbi:MAG: substrate-binding domain-containing protein [Vicinamibacterales bacterium]